MPISCDKTKDRVLKFTKKWEEESSEDTEAKSFVDDVFSDTVKQLVSPILKELAYFEAAY